MNISNSVRVKRRWRGVSTLIIFLSARIWRHISSEEQGEQSSFQYCVDPANHTMIILRLPNTISVYWKPSKPPNCSETVSYAYGSADQRLARYRAQLLEPTSKSGPVGTGFDVQKSGDARVALIGFPSVGKVKDNSAVSDRDTYLLVCRSSLHYWAKLLILHLRLQHTSSLHLQYAILPASCFQKFHRSSRLFQV